MENVLDALKREFREETNVDIIKVEQQVYVLQNRMSKLNEEGLGLAFHVKSASCELAVLDDKLFGNARFMPFEVLQFVLTSPVNLSPLESFLEAS